MSRSEPSRRSRAGAVAVAVAVVAGLLLLTGCSAGQLTATSTQRGSAGGANADAGDILVREAEIEFGDAAHGAVVYPAGSTAPLRMRIVNQGAVADRLVSATSRAASVVHLSGAVEVPAGQVLVVGDSPHTAPGDSPGDSPHTTPATPGDSPHATPATPGDSPHAAPSDSPDAIPATPGDSPSAAPGVRTAQIALTGLHEDVRAGLTYELVLVFERAGPVLLNVPVDNPTTPREASSE